MAFKLSAELNTRIAVLASDLSSEVAEQQEVWNAKTETWQDSDAGNSVLAWLQGLDSLVEDMENLETKPS
jgi:hypothetical protein